MTLDLSPGSFIFLFVSAGSSFAFVLCLAQLLARHRNSRGYLIALFWFCFALWMFTTALNLVDAPQLRAVFQWYFIAFNYCTGPSLYLFLRSRRGERLKRIDGRHFVLPAIALVGLLPHSLATPEDKMRLAAELYGMQLPADIWLIGGPSGDARPGLHRILAHDLTLLLLVGPKISVFIYVLLLVHKRFFYIPAPTPASQTGRHDRLFLNSLAWLVLAAVIVGFLSHFMNNRLMQALAATLIVLAGVGLFLLNDRIPVFSILTNRVSAAGAEEARSKLRVESSSELNAELERIDQYLEKSRVFIREGLSLTAVASGVAMEPHRLSRLINLTTGLNFNQYINSHRIRLAQELLLQDRERTVYSIALHVGFSAKSAFNRAFLKHAGMTPGEFRSRNS